MSPNREQERLADLPIGNVLVVAPAGCGKTEALASRARAIVARGEVASSQKVLALTFSIKARDNLRSRMRKVVGAGWQRRIDVRNFHGLASRVLRAHGEVIGLSPELTFPDDRWRSVARRELGVTYRNSGPFEEALRVAKAGMFDDDDVMHRLCEFGNQTAVAYEERLRAELRIDYDDMIRHGARILNVPAVSALYRAHFAMTLVDEVQDLSIIGFEMVRAVGGDRVTYAGDPAQGIYSFAGAEPEEVFARISALDDLATVTFNQSYRSSPAVLSAVNALAREIGATELICADAGAFPDEGRVISLERDDKDAEATALLDLVQQLTADEEVTIGIVGRRGTRASQLRAAADQAGLSFEDWAMPTHVPAVVDVFRRFVDEATGKGLAAEHELRGLEHLCRAAVEESDVDLLDALASAIDSLAALVADGMSVGDAVSSCRSTADPGAPVAPGLHVLTGHKGKGQEFDWVVVVGLEAGHVPDFRTTTQAEYREELRILHVMASRARYGLVVTFARKDGWRTAEPSPWLELLRAEATEFDHD